MIDANGDEISRAEFARRKWASEKAVREFERAMAITNDELERAELQRRAELQHLERECKEVARDIAYWAAEAGDDIARQVLGEAASLVRKAADKLVCVRGSDPQA